jgi:hypothetical protein
MKAEAIIRQIVALVNGTNVRKDGGPNRVILEADMGGDTLTLIFPDGSHTHVGIPELDAFDVLVDNLHSALDRT